jgi:hypothetical protein
MNIIESQAKSFIKDLYSRDKRITLELLKLRLDSKINLFTRKRDKLDFLKVLHIGIKNDLVEHELTCTTENCAYTEERNLGIFLIEQKIDYINETYIYIPKSDDAFTVEEETSLHGKLNQILDRLNKQGLGQEIIFEEIESLKNHFNLGKKTWLQLALGKIFSVTGDKMIEESVSKEIINQITDMFKDSTKLIP